MSKKLLKLTFVLVGVSLLSSACSFSTNGKVASQGIDSSIFVSSDRGENWRSMVSVPNATGNPGSIAGLGVNIITMDPNDNQALYLASYNEGLYYTYNVADGWRYVKSLPKETINDVKVDPKSKCIIYAAASNRAFRSSDCARTWSQIYFDNDSSVRVTAIAIDQYNTNNVYIGTSRGEIIKSIDSGNSWRTIQRLKEGVSRLIISPRDSRIIFVATEKNNISRFNSNTSTNPADSANIEVNFLVDNWTDLNDVLKDYDLGKSFKGISVNPKDGLIFLATEKVILRSSDDGSTWENIKLIQPEKNAIINAIAVNPQNSNDLYYVTNTTFFRSSDGGVTWTTKKLPTARPGRELLIDFKNPNVIYLGTKQIEKK